MLSNHMGEGTNYLWRISPRPKTEKDKSLLVKSPRMRQFPFFRRDGSGFFGGDPRPVNAS